MIENDNPSLDQKSSELNKNSFLDEIADSLQCWYNWLESRRTTTVEDYLCRNYRLHVHIAVGIDSFGPITHEYCIHFQLKCGRYDLVGMRLDVTLFLLSAHNTESSLNGGTDSEPAMLVNPIKFMNLPEGMSVVEVPSLMWLKRVDDLTRCWCNTSDFVDFISRSHLSAEDGELRGRDAFIGHGWSESSSQCQRQMVESRTNVENAVADNQAQVLRDGINAVDSESSAQDIVIDWVRRGIRVWFVNDYVGVALEPILGVHLKGVKVLPCSHQFEPKAVSHHDAEDYAGSCGGTGNANVVSA